MEGVREGVREGPGPGGVWVTEAGSLEGGLNANPNVCGGVDSANSDSGYGLRRLVWWAY